MNISDITCTAKVSEQDYIQMSLENGDVVFEEKSLLTVLRWAEVVLFVRVYTEAFVCIIL